MPRWGSLGTETKYGCLARAKAPTRRQDGGHSARLPLVRSQNPAMAFSKMAIHYAREILQRPIYSYTVFLSTIISWYLCLKYSPPIIQIIVNIVILKCFVYCTPVFSNSVILKMWNSGCELHTSMLSFKRTHYSNLMCMSICYYAQEILWRLSLRFRIIVLYHEAGENAEKRNQTNTRTKAFPLIENNYDFK